MKPNNFIMNTDYLSVAQIGKQEFTCTVSAGTIQPGGQIIQDYDFSITPQKGAIDQIMISKDGGDYMVGQCFNVDISSASLLLFVYRTSPSNLRAEVMINNLFSSSAVSYPAMTFRIKVASFKPPNVF